MIKDNVKKKKILEKNLSSFQEMFIFLMIVGQELNQKLIISQTLLLKKLKNILVIKLINGTPFFKRRIFTKKNQSSRIYERTKPRCFVNV